MQYLILGRGRLARHLQQYLQLLGVSAHLWSRDEGKEALRTYAQLQPQLRVLLALSDSALIELSNFCLEIFLAENICHFSGAHSDPRILGAHPLMSFSENLYSLDEYKTIPFIVDKKLEAFSNLFPAFSNPVFFLKPELKSLYHAWCSMGLNFTQYLWSETFENFEKKMNLPREILIPALLRLFKNILESYDTPEKFMTGPMVRGDQHILSMHKRALAGDPYLDVYKAFENLFLGETAI